ncbi:MAG: siderophore-interacting protein [Microbacterium sp.]|nr:siderophore-interacting protein [Microbacterium sp.]MDF2562518.1 siderophore-interacting protein [Microbacterium sp.]
MPQGPEGAAGVFRAEVRSVTPIAEGMVRVVFGGDGLRGFSSTGVGDEYVRLHFPPRGQRSVDVPSPEAMWTSSDGGGVSDKRTYTIRSVDPTHCEIAIDFVMHGDGLAVRWVRQAVPGDAVALNAPTGLYRPPIDVQWQLLFADATGLPAVCRIIEQSPPTVRTRAVVEVASPRHVPALASARRPEVTWMYGGNGHGRSRLEQAVREAELPAGPGYVWVAGETSMLRAVRKYLRHERKLPASAYKAVGYWNFAADEYRARLAALDPATRVWLESALDGDGDEEAQTDEYVARLESLGL